MIHSVSISGRMASRSAVRWPAGGDFGLAKTDAFAGIVECGGKRLYLGAGGGQRGFLGFGAFQAGELLVFQALGLGLGKVELVLDGIGLGGVVRESCWAR